MLPAKGDLADRLAAPGARMRDIRTGVGALAIGFAREFPSGARPIPADTGWERH